MSNKTVLQEAISLIKSFKTKEELVSLTSQRYQRLLKTALQIVKNRQSCLN